jgi:Cys-tRNA(Pro)/Cys-tRNA(Cys) deacylase
MTPAVNYLNKHKVAFRLHKYSHDPKHQFYGLEAAEKLALDPQRVFKTLVVQIDDRELAVAILPVATQLNLKLLAQQCGAKKATLADARAVAASTGYVLGGVSPLAQKKRLPTVIDSSADRHETIFVSGGRRGLEIEINPRDLLEQCGAVLAEIC